MREEERQRAEDGKRRVCSKCGESKSKAEFSAHTWCNASKESIACTQCVEDAAAQRDTAARTDEKACVECEVLQRREFFSQFMWEGAAARNRKCKRCVDGAKLERGKWKCVECKGAFGREHYSNWLAGRSTQKANGKQRCNTCCAGQERKRKEIAERSHASVAKVQKAG